MYRLPGAILVNWNTPIFVFVHEARKINFPQILFVRKGTLCSLLLFFPAVTPSLVAQTLHQPLHSSCISAGVFSRNQANVFSFTANQASLANLKASAIGLYGERRFLLNELADYLLAAAIHTRSGNFGLKATHYGDGNYNENSVSLAYGRRLGMKADIGAQFNYMLIKLSGGYGSTTAIGFEAGGIMHLSEKLHAGIHVSNPVGGKFGKEKEEKLPSVYSFGIGYEVSGIFFCSAEVIKEEDMPVNISTVIYYRFIPAVYARAGVSTGTSLVWLSLGVGIRSCLVDLVTSYHPQLGLTPGISLLYPFNKKNEK